MKKRKAAVMLLIAVFCSVILLGLSSCESIIYDGVNIVGAVTNGTSPIELNSVSYNFDICDYPYESSTGNFKDTASSVEINYSFYNPATYDITMPLYLLALKPSYYVYNQFDNLSSYAFETDSDDNTVLRCVYKGDINLKYNNSAQNVTEFLKGVYDERQTDSNYNDLNVYKYTYAVSDLPDSAKEVRITPSASASFFVNRDDSQWSGDGNDYYFEIGEYETVTIYIVSTIDTVLIENNVAFCDDSKNIVASVDDVTPISNEKISLDDLILSYYDAESNLSQTDWYNAVISYMKNYELAGVKTLDYFDVSDSLFYMYRYDLTVPAQSTVSQNVTVPLYPTVDGHSYDKDVYEYCLDTSHLVQWSGNPKINISVYSNGYYVKSSKDVNLTSWGFTLENTKPSNDCFTFTFCETADFDNSSNEMGRALGSVGLLVIVICLFCALVPIVAVSIVLGLDKSKRKAKQSTSTTADNDNK